jgi:enterochelin esterase-like enzyme
MKTRLLIAALILISTSAALSQTAATAPAGAAGPGGPTTAPAGAARGGRAGGRPPSAVRDPLAPGYVKAIELPDGTVPPVEADGNFIIGPTHKPAPEMSPVTGDEPKGQIFKFTLKSTDSKLYPGIARPDAPDGVVPARPAAWSRTVSVYVPRQYVPGTAAPFMVTTDGDGRAFSVLDHLIPQKKVPVMIVVAIPAGGGDGPGSERGLEYDTMSGRYSDFVETEVLPQAEKVANVKLTTDPDGRAAMGTSSGAAASMIMAWFHPERIHRVMTFSGTFVNQQSPVDPNYPHGAYGLPETLIPNSPAKPLRIFMECGDHDNGSGGGMHDWVNANELMAKVLADKGYHYKFVFARNAGHTDRPTISELYPTALEWLWQGYPIDGK